MACGCGSTSVGLWRESSDLKACAMMDSTFCSLEGFSSSASDSFTERSSFSNFSRCLVSLAAVHHA